MANTYTIPVIIIDMTLLNSFANLLLQFLRKLVEAINIFSGCSILFKSLFDIVNERGSNTSPDNE